jgi:predicted dehydrogenase
MPVFAAVRERVTSQVFGRLVFAQIWQLMDLAPWDEPAPWRVAMAHRALLEGGVHLVDLMLTLFDCAPEAVYARHSGGLDQDRDADAIHLVTLEFPDGRLGQITMNRLCRAGTHYAELRADCERASLRASLGGRAALRVGKERGERTGARLELGSGGIAWIERGLRRQHLARNPRDFVSHATTALLREIVTALRDGREPPSNAQEARLTLAVIEAAYRSASIGRRVELDTIVSGANPERAPVGAQVS